MRKLTDKEKAGLLLDLELKLLLLLVLTIGCGMWDPLWFTLRKLIDPWH